MPNRLIKDSIHTSESVNAMTDFQFRLWINLITYVDDYGRGDARPAVIKGTCFPLRERLTNKDIEAALDALAGIGCVGLYEVDGKPYLYFPNWESHQTVRNQKSKYPAPDGSCKQLKSIASKCSRNPIQSESESESESKTTAPPRAPLSGFEDFYAAYPKKVAKQDAMKAWKGLKADEALAGAILADIRQRMDGEWKNADKKFIPHPATYLRQRRWEDETRLPAESPRSAPQSNPALDYMQRDYTDEDAFGDDFYMFSPGWVKAHPEEAKKYGLTVEEE